MSGDGGGGGGGGGRARLEPPLSARYYAARALLAGATGVSMVTGMYPLVTYLRRGGMPRGVLGEWLVSVAMTAARPIGYAGPAVAPPGATAGPRPIVMVHGYAMSRACFALLARRLVRRGLGPVYGFEYWSLGGVERAASYLATFCERLQEESGASSLDLIGHSMGGLVARYYVSCLGGAEQVTNLVTVGTPHGGVPTAASALGQARFDLSAASDILRRLDRAGIPPEVRVTTLASRDDALIPFENATLEGAEVIAVDRLGHLAMLCSRRVAAQLADRLHEVAE